MKALSKGFTLIEVLIGLSLLSIMVTLLFSVLQVCAGHWEAGERKLVEVNRIQAVNFFFRQYLTTARPVIDELSEEKNKLAFIGEEKQLQFVSAFQAGAGRLGLQLLKVQLLRQDEDYAIQVSTKPFFKGFAEAEWHDVILLNHVEEFELSYRGEGSSEWHHQWQEPETIPSLVKINIRLSGYADAIELIIAIKSKKPLPDEFRDPLMHRDMRHSFKALDKVPEKLVYRLPGFLFHMV